jgi:hypothetical protein
MSIIPPHFAALRRFYRSMPSPCPYIPGQIERKLFTRLDGGGAAELNATLTRAGFRRSHDIVYRAVSVTGGHLGAGLGVVELTVALHHVFDTPRDRLIWDVGHQAYPHKILTGRRDRIRTLRQGGGLSGFTKRSESEYDPFGAAHSSTSISAGLGMAVARDLRGRRQQCHRGDRRRRDERRHGL